MKCPCCSEQHAIPYKEVYIEAVLRNFTSIDDPDAGMKQQRARSVGLPT
jgi:hypothetical protein